MFSELEQKVLSHIDQESIIQMSKDVISISSPTGKELEIGLYMKKTFKEMGLSVSWQEVEEGRANVIAMFEGSGDGKSLMFNGHMDTSYTGHESHLTGIGYKPYPVIKDDVIYGLGIYNMKGALVCYTHALKAVIAAGVKLSGDVMIAAVVGEIEKTQWGDEFVGKEYRGYGAGAHYMVSHGIVPDMCILGEPTDMKVVLGHYGSLWARISTRGPFMHTGFSMGRQHENSIRRMRDVIDAVLAWSSEWETKAAYGNKKGIVNMGGVKGGWAWRASRTPERCDLYLDVRVPPTISMSKARREVGNLVRCLQEQHPDYGIDFETYVSSPGAEISEKHEMVQAIDKCHKKVTGSLPERDTVLWGSDASVMTRYGIETVNYGPSSGERKAEGEKVAIKTLMDITRVYALAILEICNPV
ncbi:MAG: M20/M25/M40 family metallo-hydrolase [Acidobacteria bacterium]|nr:M20/M25/M40 family metallo-hydrolase [Acidobacteriota bacterium]